MITPVEGNLIIDIQKMNDFAMTCMAQDVANQIEHQPVDELGKVGIVRYVEKLWKAVISYICTQQRYDQAYVKNKDIVEAHEIVVTNEQGFRHANNTLWDYTDAMAADPKFREAVLAREECWARAKRYSKDIAACKEKYRKSGLAKPIDPKTGKTVSRDKLNEVTMHTWQCLGNVVDLKVKTGQVVIDPTATFGNNFNPEDQE